MSKRIHAWRCELERKIESLDKELQKLYKELERVQSICKHSRREEFSDSLGNYWECPDCGVSRGEYVKEGKAHENLRTSL